MNRMDQMKRKEIHRLKDSIQERIRGTQRLLMDVDKVATQLEEEVIELLHEVGSRGEELKDLIERYVKQTKTSLIEAHETNVESLNKYKGALERKLDEHEENFAKINDLLDQEKKIAKPMVNVSKVYQMVIDSIAQYKSLQVDVKLKRCALRAKVDSEQYSDQVKKLIGLLDDSEEDLYAIVYPIYFVKEFKTRNLEIHTMETFTQKSTTNIFICFDAQKELLIYSQQGKITGRVGCEVKVNDVVITDDGKILATTPDAKSVKLFTPTKKNGYKVKTIVNDNLYLHGLTAGNRHGVFAVCGTDAPNYSDKRPSETVIVEFTQSGKECKRFMVSNFAGKVYRIAQNVDDRFVLTFPKDGVVLSVDGVGQIRNSFSADDFTDCLPQTRYGREVTFWPSGVACDTVGHVLVSEWTNAVVLMLDRNLNMLRFIGRYYVCPNALTFNKKINMLFVGDKDSIQMWRTCQQKEDKK